MNRNKTADVIACLVLLLVKHRKMHAAKLKRQGCIFPFANDPKMRSMCNNFPQLFLEGFLSVLLIVSGYLHADLQLICFFFCL